MRNLDRFEGAMIGGAAGDALGYVVEFNDMAEIIAKYGQDGITEFDLFKDKALISDDTQMSLFTAAGLLLGAWAKKDGKEDKPYEYYINCAYKDWYRTQLENYPLDGGKRYTWLPQIPELYADRAAGTSCMSSLRRGGGGTMAEPLNDSKGCGGIMRVAPVALFFLDREKSIDKIDQLAARSAALTHGHPLGYIAAAGLSHIVAMLADAEDPDFMDAVLDMKVAMKRQFSQQAAVDRLIELVDQAIDLADQDLDDVTAISQIGEGWVAEETLAIAIYCVLKYKGDFEKTIIAAVNHRGDSDSTGAVAGNIVGAAIGLENIPEKFVEALEIKDTIIEMADDLYYENLEKFEDTELD